MELTCDGCGKSFEGRADARYCSGRCRTIAYRKRATPVVGVSQQAVVKTLRHPDVTTKLSPEPAERIDPATGEVLDLTPLAPEGKSLGLDGKTYTRPKETTKETPMTTAPSRLAIPQPPRYGGSRPKHAQIINNVVLAASGLCIALDEIQTLDQSLNSEEAARLADDLGEALDSFERIRQLLRSVTVE